MALKEEFEYIGKFERKNVVLGLFRKSLSALKQKRTFLNVNKCKRIIPLMHLQIINVLHVYFHIHVPEDHSDEMSLFLSLMF